MLQLFEHAFQYALQMLNPDNTQFIWKPKHA